MAEASWPDPANDRVVSEAQYEKLAARFSDDGLYGSPYDDTPVVAGAGLQVLIRPGFYASVRGFGWESGSEAFPLSIDSNDGSAGPRLDWVVLRLDRSDWTVRAAVRKGTPGGGRPALVRQQFDTGVYEIPLALVEVPVGASSLVGANVTPYPLYVGSRIRFATGFDEPGASPGALRWSSGGGYEGFDGIAWRTVWKDLSAQANLTPTSNWKTSGPCWVRRTAQGLVQVNLNLIRQGAAFYGGTEQGSPLTTVPAAYRPQGYIAYDHAHVTPDNQVRLRVEPDGVVWADNPTKTVDPGRALRKTFVYTP